MRSLLDLIKTLLTIAIVGVVLALFRQNHRWLYFPIACAMSLAGGFMVVWVPWVIFSENGSSASDKVFFRELGWVLPIAMLFTGWVLGRAVQGIQEWLFEAAARTHTRFWEPLYGAVVTALFALIIWHDQVWLGWGVFVLAVVVFSRQLSNAAEKPQESDDELYARAMQDPAIRERAASMPREEVVKMLRQMQRLDNRALRNVSTVRARYVR
jgi:hypothetical protein